MIVVTGATGKLGRQVVEQLLQKVPAAEIALVVRSAEKAADFAARGLQLRVADYSRPETLGPALAGADKLLLISSSEIGQRFAQHQAVIDAARQAGVKLLAYTSLLHADRSPLSLAAEHRASEAAIIASGLPYVLLRNGWYIENYSENLQGALASGVLLGCARQGRVSAATRADLAAAAVAVLTGEGHENKVYELAGDTSFTMSELATGISMFSGKQVSYLDLPQAEYAEKLVSFGVPRPFAEMLADSDAGLAEGALEDTSATLSRLIARPTTAFEDVLRQALR